LAYHAMNGGFSRVINPALVLGLYGDGIIERGDQSKPYRYVPVFDSADAPKISRGASIDDVSRLRIQARPLDRTPLERERYALTARLAWRGEGKTLRVEQRGYLATWGLKASTTDARLFVDVAERVMIWPHLRFHAQ